MARAGFSNGRLTIDGRPRFVLGCYDSGGGFSTDPAKWEQQIFADRNLTGIPINVYLNYWLGGMPIEPTKVMLDVLQRHGMYYLQTGNSFEGGSWTRPTLDKPFSIGSEAYVRALAQHPTALGIYIADEPYDALIPETEAHHRQLKAWAPDLLTFAALMAGFPSGHPTRTDPAMWADAADVLGVDPYPMYGKEPPAGYTLFSVADYVSKLRAAAPSNRPVWAVLQFFRGSSESRLPTADELRAQAIMAIVEGAQGIFWWEIGSNGIRRESAGDVAVQMGNLKALVTELAGLEPALVADPIRGVLQNSTAFADPVAGRIAQLQHNVAVEWLYSRKAWYQEELAALQAGDRSKSGGMLDGAANVRTRAMIADGKGYVFAYNYTNKPQPVTFTVPELGSWADTFGPYQARIYVITYKNSRLRITENKSGREYPIGEAPMPPVTAPPLPPVQPAPVPPPIPPAPPSPAPFTVSFLHPATDGQTLSGVVGVGMSTTARWNATKKWALAVDGAAPVLTAENTASSWWPTPNGWNTAAHPNGPHTLTLSVTADGATAVVSRAVNVRNP